MRICYQRVLMSMLALLLAAMSVVRPGAVASADPADPILFQDRFDDAGTASWTPASGSWSLVSDSAGMMFSEDFENGNIEQWTNNGGEWSSVTEDANTVYRQSKAEGASELLAGDASWTDYSLESDMKLISGTGAMLKFRYQDGQHFYFLYMAHDSIKIMKQNGSAQEWIGQYNGSSLDPARFVNIKVTAEGNSFTVYRDGDQVLTAVDETAPYTSGKIGLATWSTVVAFDNVGVTGSESNQAYSQSDSSGGESYAGEDAWTNYSVQTQLKPGAMDANGSAGVTLRRQANGDGYRMQYAASGKLQILKVEGGVATTLGEAEYVMNGGDAYLLKGVAAGKFLDLYVNGIKHVSAQDTTYTSGHIALHALGATASYDSVVVATEVPPAISEGHTAYYVSSSTGDDAQDGLTEATAWRTLGKVSAMTFLPGDRILLKSGDVWNEKLTLKGSGTKEDPIAATSYGTGDMPKISAHAPGSGVVVGINLSHWLIQGLAVEAVPSSTLAWGNVTSGIKIEYDNARVYEGLQIDGNEVFSSSPDTNTNGIVITASVPGTDYKEIANDIVISNNKVHDLGWYGITTSGWDNVKQEELRSQLSYGNLYVVRNEVVNMGNQGIVVQNAHDSAIERNVVRAGGQANSNGYGPGGLWYIASRDSVIRFNEVSEMKDSESGYDGAGINVDWYCDNITVEYNYTHDNKGNGFTTMSNRGAKINYNKVKGNKGEQGNGRGQIALGSFTGRPDLSTGLHDIEVAGNTIIVDVEGTNGINSASNPYGFYSGNRIHGNHIVLKEGVANTSVFSIGNDTLIDEIDNNRVYSDEGAFRASRYGETYDSLQAWQAATGFDSGTQVHELDNTIPDKVRNVSAVVDGYVRLSWSAAADEGSGIAHYNIYRGETPDFAATYANMVGESRETSFVDRERPKSNQTYYYKVEAEDFNGNNGPASDAVQAATGEIPTAPAPAKVVDFTILRQDDTIRTAAFTVTPYLANFGSISKVELYANGSRLTELTEHPYTYTVRTLGTGEHTLQYRVYEQSGAVTESAEIDILKQHRALRSVSAADAPVIDGRLEEWPDAVEFALNQLDQVKEIDAGFKEGWTPDKLSAAGYTSWDDENVYLAIEVAEEQHDLDIEHAADLWKGASIQLAVDPQRGNKPGALGYTELAYGLSNSGAKLAYRYNAIAGRATGEFSSGSFEIIRDDETRKTIYEIAIPWNELLPAGVNAAEGAELGFSFLVNYSDGSRPDPGNGDLRNGWIEYNSGIGSVKAPDQFGYFLLNAEPFDAPSLTVEVEGQQAKLNWTDSADATGYRVHYGVESGVYSEVWNTGTTTEYETAALGPGNHYFVVEAYNAYGESARSEEKSLVITSGVNVPLPDPISDPDVVYDVKLENGQAVAELGARHLKAVIRLSELNGASLAVRRGEASITLSQAVLKTLQEQAGSKETFVEVRLNPLKETDVRSGSDALAPASQVYEISVELLVDGKRRTAVIEEGALSVSLPYDSARADEELSGVYIYDEDEQRWTYIGGEVDAASKEAAFRTGESGKYAVYEFNAAFRDVPGGHWAERAIKVLAARHVVQGTGDERFSPSRPTTRAEFTAMLAHILELSPTGDARSFDDVQSDAWYADAVSAAVKAGIVSGRSANRFAPDESITRAEMAVMAVRALGLQVQPGESSAFADADSIPAWAQSYVAAAAQASIVNGRGGNQFAPQRETTRAEAAQILLNLMESMSAAEQ